VGSDEAVRSGTPDRCAATSVVGSRGSRPRALLGATASLMSLPSDGCCAIDNFANGAELRDYFKTLYGPTISVYRKHRGRSGPRGPPSTQTSHRWATSVLSSSSTMEWEYLLLTARKG